MIVHLLSNISPPRPLILPTLYVETTFLAQCGRRTLFAFCSLKPFKNSNIYYTFVLYNSHLDSQRPYTINFPQTAKTTSCRGIFKYI